MLSWCSIDRVSTRFLFLQCIPPPHTYNRKLICKRRGNCLVIVYFCYRSHSIFFSFAAGVNMTLHPVFRSSFLILGAIIGIHGSLTMLLTVFSDLGA